MKNLIIPVAGENKYKDPKIMPNLFKLSENGFMYCVASIMGLQLENFDHIYFTILAKHNKQFLLDKMLDLQFQRLDIADKAKVVILNKETRNQPETIYQTVYQENIKGGIYCKDGDSFFESELSEENSVAVFPIDALTSVNPQHKSYIAIDDMYYITNIIERKIIGNLFSAGGYYFKSADDFCSYYQELQQYDKLYLSHVIYSMLLNNKVFRPIKVNNYIDWGE